MSVVLVATPSNDLWRDAVRAGVRDIVDPHLRRRRARARARAGGRSGRPACGEQRAVRSASSPQDGAGHRRALPQGRIGQDDGGVQPHRRARPRRSTDRSPSSTSTCSSAMPPTPSGWCPSTPSASWRRRPRSTPRPSRCSSPATSRRAPTCSAARSRPRRARPSPTSSRAASSSCSPDDFAYVVVDTPAGLDERTLAVLELATDVVLVSSIDVSSIRNLGKEIDVLERARPAARVRATSCSTAPTPGWASRPSDVEAALGMKIDTAVPSSRAIPFSMNQGRPIVIEEPNSHVGPRADDVHAPVRGRRRDRDRARAPVGFLPPEEVTDEAVRTTPRPDRRRPRALRTRLQLAAVRRPSPSPPTR